MKGRKYQSLVGVGALTRPWKRPSGGQTVHNSWRFHFITTDSDFPRMMSVLLAQLDLYAFKRTGVCSK
jgi:hypothetical protein